MSSMIGGRSANRGLCAQACRLPYKLVDSLDPDRELKSPGDFLLSPKDLCSIDHLDRLASLNVDSLKIEGRMKSSEYVSSVVSVYREALDRLRERLDGTDGIENTGGVEGFDSDGNKGGNDSPNRTSIAESTARRIRVRPTEQEKEKLASVFSRGFSPAYLVGERSGEMMSYQRPNNRGQFAGRVKTIREIYWSSGPEKGTLSINCPAISNPVVRPSIFRLMIWMRRCRRTTACSGCDLPPRHLSMTIVNQGSLLSDMLLSS